MIISQGQEAINAARELTAKSEIKQIRLRQCRAQLQGEETQLKAPFGLAEAHNTTANFIDNMLRVEVAFNFQAFDASDGKVPLFFIECSFELDYEVQKEYTPDREALDAFKDGNAVFNCWPYARECVQSMTSRMALHPPPLPLLRVIPKPKSKTKTKVTPESPSAPPSPAPTEPIADT